MLPAGATQNHWSGRKAGRQRDHETHLMMDSDVWKTKSHSNYRAVFPVENQGVRPAPLQKVAPSPALPRAASPLTTVRTAWPPCSQPPWPRCPASGNNSYRRSTELQAARGLGGWCAPTAEEVPAVGVLLRPHSGGVKALQLRERVAAAPGGPVPRAGAAWASVGAVGHGDGCRLGW